MVLDLQVPHTSSAHEPRVRIPVFLSYALSFVNIGIYWNNHHHLLAATKRINGVVLWANLHLSFWLSLFPFFTGWMGENHYDSLPTASYGVVLLMAGVAYYILKTVIISAQGADTALAEALGNDVKGKISPTLYLVAVPLAFVDKWIAVGLFVVVALMWFVPDRRIESRFQAS